MGVEKILPEHVQKKPSPNLLPRRDFNSLSLKFVLVTAAAMETGLPFPNPKALVDQYLTMKEADTSIDDFIKENEKELRRIRIGCSFSPEHFNYVDDFEGISAGIDQEKALAGLRIVVEELGIKDIRLGIRWSEVVDKQTGELSPDLFNKQYKPLLDYCIKNNVNICLNVGPVKTFRYPEDYVPEPVLVSNKQEKGSLIAYKSGVAEKGVSYLDALLSHITRIYSEQELERFKIIQPDNEPFHSAGENGWTMSPEYLAKTILTIDKYFPHASILLNSAGEKDLGRIYLFFHELSKNPNMRGRLIAGIDFYYKKPDTPTWPIFGKVDAITWNAVQGKKPFEEYIAKFREIGVAIEDTEIQAEPWGSETSPGNSSQDFFYVIKRCLDHLIDKTVPKSVLRVWGIEELVLSQMDKTATPEHKKILEAIRRINSLS